MVLLTERCAVTWNDLELRDRHYEMGCGLPHNRGRSGFAPSIMRSDHIKQLLGGLLNKCPACGLMSACVTTPACLPVGVHRSNEGPHLPE